MADLASGKAHRSPGDKTKDEDVRTLLGELKKITSKEVETFLETDDGKMILLPKLDSHFDKAIVTWKENNLDKEFETKLAAEITKRYPKETEEQKRLKTNEEELETVKADLAKEKLTNKIIALLNEAKLPLDIIDSLIGKDEVTTLANVEKYKDMMNAFQKTLTDGLYKEYGRTPAQGIEEPTPLETLEKQYTEAVEKGDVMAAVKVQDEILKKKQKDKIKTGVYFEFKLLSASL